MLKEFGAIDYIDFSPIPPYNFAVTCSVRVQIYNPVTKLVTKNISKFHKNAYGGTFGKDGRLLVAGNDEGYVKLFDTSTKSVLRLFQEHKAATHRALFTSDKMHIASFSDDRSVKLWDIASEKCVHTYSDHVDYIRAGCVSPVSANIIVSGGYDNKIKMYDCRTSSTVLEVNHGSPVESLLFLPTGGIFISAGGTTINVWDAFSGGKLIATMSQHTKTITCIRLASNGQKLMSGSLDRKVKIYDIASYQTVHSMDYPNAVLSLGVSPNNDTLAVGLIDGLVSVQRMDAVIDANEKSIEKRKIPSNSSAIIDETIDDYQKKTEAKYDKWLRKYEYTKALDEVMLPYVVNKKPHVTVALMQELIRRKGLERALIGRTHKSLSAIIRFLIRYIGELRFTRVLIDVTNVFLNVYEMDFPKFTEDIGKQLIYLSKKMKQEMELTVAFNHFYGALELLLAGANVGDASSQQINFTQKSTVMKPSEYAQENFFVDID